MNTPTEFLTPTQLNGIVTRLFEGNEDTILFVVTELNRLESIIKEYERGLRLLNSNTNKKLGKIK